MSMSGLELSIAAVAFILGYIAISAAWPKKKEAAPEERPKNSGGGPSTAGGAPPQAWHEVMGVPRSANAVELQAAYRVLMSQYHPDKVAQLGPELQRTAHEMTQRINGAYEEGMREVASRN